MNPADAALQQSFPSVMVPRFGALAPMERPGERLLIAANGVFLEIVRPWLRIVRHLGAFQHRTAIPYGEAAEATELRCGRIPASLIGKFAMMAGAAHPKETGGWVVWNADSASFRLVPVRILEHSGGHLKYERPLLTADDVLVVDCHSHGRHPAFFSSTDDHDDRHDVKFAFVLGNCDAATPSMALRLCAKGIFEKVEKVPADWYAAAREEVLA
ncbi:PRTRC system protein A [compost metagenome]